uniref:Uncharacterized protein n=2 Tax=Picea TaxID=3328 RepID=A0A101M5G3_PICGL|nr:hypothetical protein ABT39_MTgene1026 [Picea glauca]QHR90053.1 hypothetical protein Q903MT_gene4076 [Picea sitchensis]
MVHRKVGYLWKRPPPGFRFPPRPVSGFLGSMHLHSHVVGSSPALFLIHPRSFLYIRLTTLSDAPLIGCSYARFAPLRPP